MSDFAPIQRSDWLEAPEGLHRIPDGSVTSPSGFVAGGVVCGLKPSGARDVGVLCSTRPCTSWLVDTINALPSAPVELNRTRDRSGFRAVVVNAGIANAATGREGLEDARAMAARAAAALGLADAQVVVSSTGTIGTRVPSTVLPSIDAAAEDADEDGGVRFAEAICTTDRWAKAGAFTQKLPSGDQITLGIAAKGAGMIRPTMATMLAYVTTDAALEPADLAAATQEAADAAFNRISVDAQMSPSDTLVVLANGDGPALEGADRECFQEALTAVCRWAAIQMVKDGEGARHAVRVQVSGARTSEEAHAVARAVGESSLVKTALFGRDPNWGRISQAVGQALARTPGIPATLEVEIDGHGLDHPDMATTMARDEYDISIRLGRGSSTDHLWVCDLGHDYVTLNAEYHT